MKRVLLLSVLLLVGCSPKKEASTTTTTGTAVTKIESSQSQQRKKVKTVEVKTGQLSSLRSTSVTLKAEKESTIAAKTGGTVAQVLLQEGAQVAAGQAVLSLDATNAQNSINDAQLALDSARINLKKAESAQPGNIRVQQTALQAAQDNANLAQKRAAEGQQLYAAGGIALVDLQSLQANAAQAQSNLSNAREQLSRLQRSNQEDFALLRVQVEQAQSRVSQAQTALGDLTVRAPFAGVISEVRVNQGEFLPAGNPAFVIADTSSLEATFRLPPDQAEQIRTGDTLQLSYQGQEYPVKISRRTTVPAKDSLVEITAIFKGEGLGVGTTASLAYRLALAKGYIVPAGAVRLTAKGNVVIANRAGRAVPVPVQVLGEAEGKMAITGIETDEQVVYPLPADVVGGETLEVVQ